MELKIVSEVCFEGLDNETMRSSRVQNPHNPLLSTVTPGALPLGGSHNIAHEILMGNDESLEAHDFMQGDGLLGDVLDVNSAMERSRGM